MSSPGLIDGQAWAGVRFLEPPWCARCGIPLPYDEGAGALCGACLARPPKYSRARAAFIYDAASRNMVLELKHAARVDGVAAFGVWMARAGAEALFDRDALIPAPLHAARLRARRFNQALLLARAVSQASGVPVRPHALVRVKPTPSQAGKSGAARRRNVSGAFRTSAAFAADIKGARLALVDDVYTTGATAEACVRALLKAGAEDVSVITLARVVLGAARVT